MSDPQRPGPPWPPEQYNRSGETEWIPRVQSGRRPDEPFRFQEEPAPAKTNPALTWALRAAGLIAVAVVSGLVFFYVRGGGETTTTPPTQSSKPRPTGVYEFVAHPDVTQPRVDSDCAQHAYGKTQELLAQPGQCRRVTQALYTADVKGKQALVAVSVVRMGDKDKATGLVQLVNANETGNIKDLLREGVVKAPPLRSLSNGYASQLTGDTVVIIEADYAPAKGKAVGTKADKDLLDKVCEDALRLGPEIDPDSGG
ncbi:hypothetical protein [Actinokineospora globicatena]|uniref:hypothetical protein n=1 Tax=Actinokineospora globicatena TaxID=103729 RepID=UPI0020A2D920|nr:hypothetical protein [Actinokineospora globicatena]MCP2304229.1 hypothetical protein [Actinokineospora globicatena]GLW78411.1 hypothetical protein Aglo01_28930 [Actinokineospora globicatena]GLW84925.1 hypothetical protein Aglo02_25650 [Actinokineospora globicatena]